MAFPADPLGYRVRVAPGADLTAHPDGYPWQDVTADLVPSRRLRHKRGSADEQAEGSSENNLVLRNSSSRVAGVEGMVARYSPDNPMSDLWPHFDLNCPVELALDIGDGNGFQILSRSYLSDSPDEWPGQSGRLAYVHLRADGLFRRMGQWELLADPLTHTLQAFGGGAVLDLWPMTDGTAATEWANAVADGHPMRIVGRSGVALADSSAVAGSSPLPTFSGDGAHGLAQIRHYVDTTRAWTTVTVHRVDSSSSSITPLVSVHPQGGITTQLSVSMHRFESKIHLIKTINGADTSIADVSYTPSDIENRNLWLLFTVDRDGGTISATLYDEETTELVTVAGSLSFGEYGRGIKLQVASATPAGVNHVCGSAAFFPLDVAATFPSELATIGRAMQGFAAEKVNDRINRVGAEVGVAVDATPGLGPAMGPQPLRTRALDVFRECEKTGNGILDDSMGLVGYRAFSELLNQDPVLVLDGSDRELFHPLSPTGDDQKTKTQVTVTQPDGTSVTVRDQPAVNRIGLYERRADANLATAAQMRHLAGWLLHEGTRRGKRIPQLTLDLRAAPQLAPAAMALRLGDRIQVVNPPPQLGPNPIDVMFVGWDTTALHRRRWRLTANCLPYVHQVAAYGPYPHAAHQASGTTGSWSVTAPPGDLDGATVLLLHAVDVGGIADMGTPTGGTTWNLLHEAEDMGGPGDGAARLWWKVGGDSEPAAYGLTQHASADGVAIMAVVHGVDSSLLVSDVEASTSGSGTAVTTPAVTMPAGGGLDLRFGAIPSDVNTFSAPAGFGLIAGGEVATDFVSAGFAARIVGAGDAGSADFTLNAAETVGRFGATVLLPVPAGYSRYGHAGAAVASGLWLNASSGSEATCPDSPALDIVGDLDVRADVTLGTWGTFFQTLIAKWDSVVPLERSYLLQLASNGRLRLLWSEDGSTILPLESTAEPQPAPSGRLAVRATLDVDDGGNHKAVFYTAPSMAGPWTQLGDPLNGVGTTSIFSGSAPLEVGAASGSESLQGLVHAIEVRDGIDGTLAAAPVFDAQPAGTTSFDDAAGNTWTVGAGAQILGDFVAGTDTQLYLTPLAGPAYARSSMHPACYPLDLRIAGAQVRVTGMGKLIAAVQEATVDIAPVNGVTKTIPAGSLVTDWDRAIYSL